MSLVNLAHVCSHLQNASRARLGFTSIPYTKLHLAVSHQLQKSGFISTVSLGGPEPPAPGALLTTPQIAEPVTEQNIASRRLWLGLKYWNSEPVIGKMSMVSRPTRRIWMCNEDLGKLMRGRPAGYVKGLRQVGECLYVTTDRGIMELREAVERGLGGMLLCRIY